MTAYSGSIDFIAADLKRSATSLHLEACGARTRLRDEPTARDFIQRYIVELRQSLELAQRSLDDIEAVLKEAADGS